MIGKSSHKNQAPSEGEPNWILSLTRGCSSLRKKAPCVSRILVGGPRERLPRPGPSREPSLLDWAFHHGLQQLACLPRLPDLARGCFLLKCPPPSQLHCPFWNPGSANRSAPPQGEPRTHQASPFPPSYGLFCCVITVLKHPHPFSPGLSSFFHWPHILH